MLRLAMKAIPLRHDVRSLDIVFEDDHIIAVNKPPGVLTAPKHRYIVSPIQIPLSDIRPDRSVICLTSRQMC